MPQSPLNFRSLAHPVRRLLQKVRRRAKLFLRGESPGQFFDLDDREAIARITTSCSLMPPQSSPREAAYRDGKLERGEKLYELREDLRREIPLALTPAQRGEYFRWFCQFGWKETDIEPMDVLRALFEQDAQLPAI